ncbi:hypothetical protein ACLBX9_26515 [Methylobacterium sp. A49B]|uniref:hypothetical protein n=1 Tax=Methylobacterium mesophilicum TaxID=39956 RepID=UPI0002C5FE90|nr:hypothetical protein [Methylobacterium mesophilicum]MBE7248436.1 hypothetical protein [Actinomycetospora chiangmaiensis]
MAEVIRVRPTHDGTYTVYRGTRALICGLTRLQAERYEASLSRQLRSDLLAAGL